MFLSIWTTLSEINVKTKAQAPDQQALLSVEVVHQLVAPLLTEELV